MQIIEIIVAYATVQYAASMLGITALNEATCPQLPPEVALSLFSLYFSQMSSDVYTNTLNHTHTVRT